MSSPGTLYGYGGLTEDVSSGEVYDPATNSYSIYGALVFLTPIIDYFATSRVGDTVAEFPVVATVVSGDLDPNDSNGVSIVAVNQGTSGFSIVQEIQNLGTQSPATLIVASTNLSAGVYAGELPIVFSYDGGTPTDYQLDFSQQIFAPAVPTISYQRKSRYLTNFGIVHAGFSARQPVGRELVPDIV